MIIKESEASNYYCCHSNTRRGNCLGKNCMVWEWYYETPADVSGASGFSIKDPIKNDGQNPPEYGYCGLTRK